MTNRIQKIGRGIVYFLAGEFLQTWVWPFVGTGAGVVIGWLEGYSLFYLVVGGAFLFASFSAGLLCFAGWRAMSRVEHKLTLRNMRHKPIFRADESLLAIQFGFNLSNSATYPIQFKIEDLRTIVTLQGVPNALYSPNKGYKDAEYTVDPHSTAFFDDYRIEIPPAFTGLARGRLHCRLYYGKGGRLNYGLEIKKTATFNLQANQVKGGRDWYDE